MIYKVCSDFKFVVIYAFFPRQMCTLKISEFTKKRFFPSLLQMTKQGKQPLIATHKTKKLSYSSFRGLWPSAKIFVYPLWEGKKDILCTFLLLFIKVNVCVKYLPVVPKNLNKYKHQTIPYKQSQYKRAKKKFI